MNVSTTNATLQIIETIKSVNFVALFLPMQNMYCTTNATLSRCADVDNSVIMRYVIVEVMKMVANTKSNVNIRIDTNVKDMAVQLLDRMGLDQTTAIDMFYRQIIAERRLPFQPVAVKTYGEQLSDIIKRKGIPRKTVELNSEGHIIADKDKDPDLYDWAVNG